MRWQSGVIGILTAALIACSGWAYSGWRTAKQEERALEALYQSAFYTQLSNVEDVDLNLGKASISADPAGEVQALSLTSARAAEASTALAQLPLPENDLSATRRFLNQVGDYSSLLAQRVAGGQQLREEDREKLWQLHQQTAHLNQQLQQSAAALQRSAYRFASLQRSAPEVVRAAQTPLDALFAANQSIAGLPTFVYDGPMSDQVQNRPFSLTGSKVTASDAVRAAQRFVALSGGHIQEANAVNTVVGPVHAYAVSIRGTDESGLVDVSQTGGHILFYQSDRSPARATWNEEQAKHRAETFLDRVGFHGFQVIYHVHNGNTLIVQAVPRTSGALIYPDMVKLSVGLDTGEILAFDGRSYFMNHHTRHLAPPKQTIAQARAQLNHLLQVGRTRLVVVTTSDQAHEVLAYETEVSKDGETYLVYTNADNGQEVKVLRLIDVGGGQLTR